MALAASGRHPCAHAAPSAAGALSFTDPLLLLQIEPQNRLLPESPADPPAGMTPSHPERTLMLLSRAMCVSFEAVSATGKNRALFGLGLRSSSVYSMI